MRKAIFLLLNVVVYFLVQPLVVRTFYGPEYGRYVVLAVMVILFLLNQNLPYYERRSDLRLNAMMGGYILCLGGVVCLTLGVFALGCYYFSGAFRAFSGGWLRFTLDWSVCVVLSFVSFFNGFMRMMLLSRQLGMWLRLLWVLLWWVPVVNLVLTVKVCRRVRREYLVERSRVEMNYEREERQVCATHYPVLLVHGIFFRDWQVFNYWGRIPAELKRNGCRVYYGHHQSAASIADSARELAEQIRRVIDESGAEKVNIIAHSKGGLDARYAISRLGMDRFVATLTTINTPHRGCLWEERLLRRFPLWAVRLIANRYNSLFRRLGDPSPNFLAGIAALTAHRMERFNREVPDAAGVKYRSVMSVMSRSSSAQFPLNLGYRLVKPVEGDNDGLVGVGSAWWGERLPLVMPKGKRGLSHGDMIDLFRENIDDFDVREFYVSLVSSLREIEDGGEPFDVSSEGVIERRR